MQHKQQKVQKEIPTTPNESENKDENENISESESLNGSDPLFISSMLSHFNPNVTNFYQRPASISSMISHCVLSPPPGSSLLSMEDVLEALDKAVGRLFQSMKCFNNPSSD